MSNGKLFFKYKDKEYEIDFNSRVKELESEAVDCLVINGKYPYCRILIKRKR